MLLASRFALLVVVVASAAACSSGPAPAKPSSAFVGTWTCSGTASEAFTSPPDIPGTTATITDTEVFAATSGDGVTATTENEDAGGSVGQCQPATFSVSGTTATTSAPRTCSSGEATYVFQSETFVVSGTTAASTGSGTVSAEAPDGGVAYTGSVQYSMTCSLE
jgi:hypothetical protein